MKKTPLRKRGKSPLSKAKAKAWKEFSLWVRERDNYKCYTCGKQGKKGDKIIHAGHFISRRHNATLYDEMNCRAQCYKCNIWDYGASHLFSQKLIEEHGQDEFNALVDRGKGVKQFTVKELEEIYEEYKEKNK